MAASSTTSKSKSTPVPTPTPAVNRTNSTSVQVSIKASPSVAPEDESTIKVASKRDKGINGAGGTIKLKKPVPKHNKPGNWREGSVVDQNKKKGTDTPSTTGSLPTSPGPVVNQLDDNARDAFATGRPLEDGLESRVCKHCKKTVLKTALKAHLTACLKAKKDKALRKKEQKEARERERRAVENDGKDDDGDTNMGDDDEDEKGHGIKTSKKSAGKKLDLSGGKKRKLDADAEKGPKSKKKKEELKVKTSKPKGPVDVEKQCGVLKDGVPCARSLTCKSHSMGAKRAVPGRSLPYDMLLAAYQKKNQAKQQKAAIDANAPLEDEDANVVVDSDEELAAMQAGLANWTAQSVVPNIVHEPISRTYQKYRLYEQLHNATNGFTIDIFKVNGYGAQKLAPDHPENLSFGDGDAEGEPDTEATSVSMASVASRRATSFTMTLPPQRRASGIQAAAAR